VQTRGFGLGLAFVKKIIMAHRGKIKLESIPGVGSDFRVSLPQS
jgi:two-component system phosphate regulon sensor histidine kinase PhoR